MTKANAVQRKVSDLIPDNKNANKGTVRGLAMLEDSLRANGAGRSILVDKNNRVIAGNKTMQSYADIGLTETIVVPTDGKQLVVVQRIDIDLDTPQGRALALLDNRVGEVDLEWDADALQALLDDGVDLSALWDEDELAELLKDVQDEPAADPGAQIDRAEELQQKWNVKRGDLWTIGDHRLLCGDSTNADDVARVMGGERADAVVTDPPYGMDLDTDWSSISGSLRSIGAKNHTTGNKYEPVIGDDKPFDPSHIFRDFSYCKEMFLWGADYYAESIPNRTSGSWLVWDKRKETQSEAIGAEFELCWSKVKHKRRMLRHDWFGFLSSSNAADARNRQHPTQKPVTLIADVIEQWVSKNAIVVDCYSGSGTTLVACQQTARRGRAIEIEPKYVAVALERLSLMGLVPKREA